MGLCDLPPEVLSHVLTFVALQRYEYSESRRPIPSALVNLSLCDRRLHELAQPLIYRNAVHGAEKATRRHHVQRLVHRMSHGLMNDNSVTVISEDHRMPRLHTLMIDGSGLLAHLGAGGITIKSSTVQRLRLRKVFKPDTFQGRFELPALRELDFELCRAIVVQSLLYRLAGHSTHLRRLSVTFPAASKPSPVVLTDSAGVALPLLGPGGRLNDWPADILQQLEELRLAFPPGGHGEGHTRPRVCLLDALKGFKLAEGSALKSLSLQIRLEVHASALKVDFEPFRRALGSFAHVADQIRHLALDDYVAVSADDVAYLASLFPALEKLEWGDRTVWLGSFSEHRMAMRGWTRLRELTLPRWEGHPRDTIKVQPEDDPDSYSTAAQSMCAVLAHDLPNLELLCYSGNLSQPEWARIRRRQGEEAGMWQVEAVTMLSMDLGRP